MKKYDERDTLFSRVALKKDSKEYNEYYRKNPEQQSLDDMQRRQAFRHNLRKSEAFKKRFFPLINHNKKHIKLVFDMAESHPVKTPRIDLEPSFANNIKEITKYFGATDVGITALNDFHYYSHLGGVSEHLDKDTYNEQVVPRYKTAIVFTVEMDKDMINRAPMYEELLATEEAYLKVAIIGSRLTMYLKDLGYKAIPNNSEYYLAPLVPLAYDAGLGEIGMANHIVTMEYGNRVRLGAVFTTLEVDTDQPIDYGLTAFCKQCALCLSNCPSKAITHKTRIVNGRQFYKFDDNKCYDMWLKSGTDCGTCISACPLTQGVDLSKLVKIKEEPSLIKEIMDEHYQKHGRRVYQKHDLDIVKMEVTDDKDN
jgi:epoxyqueuosine reductase QueG